MTEEEAKNWWTGVGMANSLLVVGLIDLLIKKQIVTDDEVFTLIDDQLLRLETLQEANASHRPWYEAARLRLETIEVGGRQHSSRARRPGTSG